MKSLDTLKKQYLETDMPNDLELKINRTFKEYNQMKNMRHIKTGMVAAAALLVVFTGAINVNHSFADSLTNLPVIGKIVQVLSFRFDVIETENVHANIESPVITGLENEVLQSSLNQKYFEENKTLYDVFMDEMKAIEEKGGHLGVDTGFIIKTDTERMLSIGRYFVNTVASSSTTMTYDTVDKIEGILITLPSLFTDENYIEVISEYLTAYMLEDMDANPYNIYWVKEDDFTRFEKIDANQNFYLTDSGKLVISFDKYEVAPGYMGVIEFEIPTEVIKHLLVSDMYVK